MQLRFQAHDISRTDRPDGSVLLRAREPLQPATRRTTDWLDFWAEETPNAIFLAERSAMGWREIAYRQARAAARGVASGLIHLGLTSETPVLILSGNSVAHGLLALGAQYVGIPIVPIAEQYARLPEAHGHIDDIVHLVRPGAVFVEDLAIAADLLARPTLKDLYHLSPSTMAKIANIGTERRVNVGSFHAAVGPETIAKILMTSGSTSAPKGVLTTHKMMCTNQAQLSQALPLLGARRPVLVDWLPWNHVFGGSHNFNLVLSNGGTLYIDAGKPVPGLIDTTLRNNRNQRATISFNVPQGFAALRDAMAVDAAFADAFFADLDMLFYAGASLPQDVWDDLHEMAHRARPGRDMPLFTSSWGLTETAPAAVLQHEPTDQAGVVGVPLPGVDVKLVPVEEEAGRFGIRVRGPSVFQGYFNDPGRSDEAFDEEGYFITGDAMRFVDPSSPSRGLRFDGRLSEDFKLQSGTWVRAAALRLQVLDRLQGLAQDVVLTGEGRQEVGVLIVPSPDLRHIATEDAGAMRLSDQARIADALAGMSGGVSARISRALILAEPPSIARGEITAKGNLNLARLRQHRSDLLARLYDDTDPATILIGGV
ncbi:AMP-binding protein [Gymnodinialimonas sp. 2305UL16-5]|uniref:AMP-binding protein n=1 Tax=Gymnodinialimonas mytili TaxID=3126503 RepID=UPI0030AA2F9F